MVKLINAIAAASLVVTERRLKFMKKAHQCGFFLAYVVIVRFVLSTFQSQKFQSTEALECKEVYDNK